MGLVDESLDTERKELRLDRFLLFGLLKFIENRLEKGFYTAVRDILKGLRQHSDGILLDSFVEVV